MCDFQSANPYCHESAWTQRVPSRIVPVHFLYLKFIQFIDLNILQPSIR